MPKSKHPIRSLAAYNSLLSRLMSLACPNRFACGCGATLAPFCPRGLLGRMRALGSRTVGCSALCVTRERFRRRRISRLALESLYYGARDSRAMLGLSLALTGFIGVFGTLAR